MEYYLGESDLRAALQTRHSIQERVKRAGDLYIDGELDQRKYSKIKRESVAALLSVSVPDVDDTLISGWIYRQTGRTGCSGKCSMPFT